MSVGKNIRYYRKKRGLTQEELAEKLGITASYLSYMELHERRITIEVLQQIAEILDISIVKLLDNVIYDEQEQAWIHLGDTLSEEGITPEQAQKWIRIAKQFNDE